MRFRMKLHFYRLPLTLDSPRSRQPRGPFQLKGDISKFDVTVDFRRGTREETDPRSEVKSAKRGRASVFEVRRTSGVRIIFGLYVYICTRRNTRIHMHTDGQAHVHDTRVTRVRVARVPRAQTYAYVSTIIVSRR